MWLAVSVIVVGLALLAVMWLSKLASPPPLELGPDELEADEAALTQWAQTHLIAPLNKRTGRAWEVSYLMGPYEPLGLFNLICLRCIDAQDEVLNVLTDQHLAPLCWAVEHPASFEFELMGWGAASKDGSLRALIELLDKAWHRGAIGSLSDAELKRFLDALRGVEGEGALSPAAWYAVEAAPEKLLAWFGMRSRQRLLNELLDAPDERGVRVASLRDGCVVAGAFASGEGGVSEGQRAALIVAQASSCLERLRLMAQWRAVDEPSLSDVMDCLEVEGGLELRWAMIHEVATRPSFASLMPILKPKLMRQDDEPWMALYFGALVRDDSEYRSTRYASLYQQWWRLREALARPDVFPSSVEQAIEGWWLERFGAAVLAHVGFDALLFGVGRFTQAMPLSAQGLELVYGALRECFERELWGETSPDLRMLTRVVKALGAVNDPVGRFAVLWLECLEPGRMRVDAGLWRVPLRSSVPPHALVSDDDVVVDAFAQAHLQLLYRCAKADGRLIAQRWLDHHEAELGERLLLAIEYCGGGEALMALEEHRGRVGRGARKRLDRCVELMRKRLGEQGGELSIAGVSSGGELSLSGHEGGELTQAGAVE